MDTVIAHTVVAMILMETMAQFIACIQGMGPIVFMVILHTDRGIQNGIRQEWIIRYMEAVVIIQTMDFGTRQIEALIQVNLIHIGRRSGLMLESQRLKNALKLIAKKDPEAKVCQIYWMMIYILIEQAITLDGPMTMQAQEVLQQLVYDFVVLNNYSKVIVFIILGHASSRSSFKQKSHSRSSSLTDRRDSKNDEYLKVMMTTMNN